MNNSLTLKQKAVVATLAVVALYVGAVLFWFVSAEKTWKKSAAAYRNAKSNYEKETRLIGEKGYWEEACEKEQAAMLMFDTDKATDTTWLQKTDEVAASNLVQVTSRKSQEEASTEVGENVRVLPITASWDASLQALVKFMYSLENSDEGLFDFAKLVFKPSAKKGYLKGTFTVNCAYRRGKVEKAKKTAEEESDESDEPQDTNP